MPYTTFDGAAKSAAFNPLCHESCRVSGCIELFCRYDHITR